MEYIKAYGGNDSYIFISYAHRDAESVLPIIKNLTDNGYRTWYDEGIEPGTSWDDYIADHVLGCSYFIAFVSPSYLASSNCMDELNFARDENKKLLLVYLSPVDLPAGMRMRLNRLQAINKYTFENEEKFFEKLFSADGIDKMRDTASSEPSLQSKATSSYNRQKGTLIFSKGTYTGEITNGKADGTGKIIWNSGGDWFGEWTNGAPLNGHGTWYYNNGNTYIGELKNGKANGMGKIIWSKGGEWFGEWKNNNAINGKGTYHYPNGDVFTGDFQQGKASGYGKTNWALGGEWSGSWVNGKAYDGNGTIHNQGNIYNGALHNGKAEGYGTIKWKLGGEWKGEWVDDHFYMGKGTAYFYKNGILDGKYEGEIKFGKCHGMGSMYWATTDEKTGKSIITNQWRLSGEWRNNQIWNGEGHNAAYEPRKKVRNGRIVLF